MDCKNVNVPSLQGTNRSPILCTKILFILLFCGSGFSALSQRQLVVLKNEEVLARYQIGDVIHFAREGDKEILVQRILDMNDTLLMMNFDSVAYYRIKKLDIRGRKANTYAQKFGRYMMIAGVMLPLIELLNTGVFQDESQEAHISSGVAIASGVLLAGGAILTFTKKPYFKPGRKNHLMIVDNRSPFYKAKPVSEGYISPLIPRN